jgi:curved DNA-binding protein CbpA
VESPYDVLGVEPDAGERAVVEAYRRRVKEAHPDHGGSKEEFQRVRRAYERIRDGDVEAAAGADAGRDERDGAADAGGPTADADRPGDDDAGDSDGDGDDGDGGDAGPEGVRVEYLNYDVLADRGWGLDDEDLFEKAAAADLDPDDYGRILVGPRETLLEAAENRGFAWPYACRGGACTNCAVMVKSGEMPTPPGHILPPDLIDRGIRLSCISAPTTGETQVVFNVKHLPDVDDLRLPPSRFEQAHATD